MCLISTLILTQHTFTLISTAGCAPERLRPRQEGTGSVRFGSRPFEESSARFGLVRFGDVFFPGSARFGLCFSDASGLGLVRFGSVPRLVPTGSRIKRFGLVRLVRFGFYSLLRPFQSHGNHVGEIHVGRLTRTGCVVVSVHACALHVLDRAFIVRVRRLMRH